MCVYYKYMYHKSILVKNVHFKNIQGYWRKWQTNTCYTTFKNASQRYVNLKYMYIIKGFQGKTYEYLHDYLKIMFLIPCEHHSSISISGIQCRLLDSCRNFHGNLRPGITPILQGEKTDTQLSLVHHCVQKHSILRWTQFAKSERSHAWNIIA